MTEVVENAYAHLNGRAWRAHIGRRVGPDRVDDVIHSAMVDFIQALQRAQIRDPERLKAFIGRIVQRRIFRCYEERVVRGTVRGSNQYHLNGPEKRDICSLDALPHFDVRSPEPTSEHLLIEREEATRALASLSEIDREALIRFYAEGSPLSLIRREMSLTPRQFSNIKHRAKLKAKAALEKPKRWGSNPKACTGS